MKNTESIMKFAAAGIQGLDLVTGGKGCKSKKSKTKKSKKSGSKCKTSGTKKSKKTGSKGGSCYSPCA